MNEFECAIKKLERIHSHNQHSLYTLSLLYQIELAHDKEMDLINKSLVLFPDWEYAKKRKSWLNLSMFEKCTKRSPLHLQRDPLCIPKNETMENLCIVSGADENYFYLLVECLESIKATRFYTNIPIHILDCGLTDENKAYLYDTFKVKSIKDPGWDIDVELIIDEVRHQNINKQSGLKGCVSRSFIANHFPGYRYYLWLDADTWVQDERTLDQFVCTAEKKGLSASKCIDGETWDKTPWFKTQKNLQIIPKHFFKEIINKKAVSVGVFCIDNRTNFFDIWCNIQTQCALERGKYQFGVDELSLGVACVRFGFNDILHQKHQYYFLREGYPLIHNNTLHLPSTFDVIGIIHLNGRRLKKQYYAPMARRSMALSPYALFKNKSFFVKKRKPLRNVIDAPLHYRILTKPQELIEEAKLNLNKIFSSYSHL